MLQIDIYLFFSVDYYCLYYNIEHFAINYINNKSSCINTKVVISLQVLRNAKCSLT